MVSKEREEFYKKAGKMEEKDAKRIKKQTKQWQEENEKANKKREQKLNKKPEIKGISIQALESREEFLRKKLEKTKSKVFDYKMDLIKIEFDLKHTLPTDDAVEIANTVETLSQKENTVKHNLKVHEKRLNQMWKALDEVARERKSRTLKSDSKSKVKPW